VSDCLCETVLSLPIHPYMERNDVEEVSESIKECLKNAKLSKVGFA